MIVPRRGYSRLISFDAENALKLLVEKEGLNWLCPIISEQGYVTIVDIGYENGRPFRFDEGLKELHDHLTKPITDYGLSDSEIRDYEELLLKCGLKEGESYRSNSEDVLHLLQRVDKGYRLTEEETTKLLSVTALDLWDQQISRLPKSIGYLSNLKALGIGKNRIRTLPKAVWGLQKLQKFDLSWTNIKSFPEEIVQLQELRGLYLNGTRVKTLPDELGRIQNLKYIEINDTEITKLPDSLSANKRLPIIDDWEGSRPGIYARDANVSTSQTDTFYIKNDTLLQLLFQIDAGHQPTEEELSRINNKESFQLSGPEINDLPISIGLLKSLKELDLQRSSIRTLPESVGQLKQLERLDLRDSNITELPDSIGNLSSLQMLGLSGTQIKEVPSVIRKLKNIKELYLRGTQITFLPNWISELSNLQKIDLYGTAISSLPVSIGNLTSLQYISLSGTKLTALPDSFGQLSNLQTLNLYNTSISSLPECVMRLANLRALDLRNTNISELPNSIERLINLQTLSLGASGIDSLPESIKKLTNLQSLGISNTRISALPEWIGELPNLRHLNLMGLTLPCIPESLALRGIPFVQEQNLRVAENGINLFNVTLTDQDIDLFLNNPELIPSLYIKTVAVNECRVIFLGDGGSGKSYTIRRILAGGRMESESMLDDPTTGIKIYDYHLGGESDNITLHFWDFGGQQLYHAMHRLFINEACYVVTIRSRDTDSTERARYWLREVSAYAPNSPVLLFVNCWDNVGGRRTIDESILRREYPNIIGVRYCSAMSANATDFRNNITEPIIQMVKSSDSISRKMPVAWFNLKKSVEEELQYRYYLSRAHYHNLCAANGIGIEHAPELLSLFNHLGICFSRHRDKGGKELTDYNLLNPSWLLNALFAIINETHALNGKIKKSDIIQTLCSRDPGRRRASFSQRTMPELVYTETECSYILGVAEALDLCYRIDDTAFLFPSLCNVESPSNALDYPERFELHFSYYLRYSYLPESTFQKLIIRCMRYNLPLSSYWLRGMIFEIPNNRQIIVRKTNDQSLSIDIFSVDERRPYEFFWVLRKRIEEINRETNLKATDYILNKGVVYPLSVVIDAGRENRTLSGTDGYQYEARAILRDFYEDSIIRFLRKDDGQFAFPVVSREYHYCGITSKALRNALYYSYDGKCPLCGAKISDINKLTIEHILPRHYEADATMQGYVDELSASGFDTEKPDFIENYIPSDPYCNHVKNDRTNTYSVPYLHDVASLHTPTVLKLMGKDGADMEDTSAEDTRPADPNEKYAHVVDETINKAIGYNNNQLPSYYQFCNNVTRLIPYDAIPFLVERYSFLFSVDGNSLEIKPAHEADLQELIYQLFLIDNGRVVVSEYAEYDYEGSDAQIPENPKGGTAPLIDDNAGDVGNDGSEEHIGGTVPSYADLEKATKIVLETFEQWLKEKSLSEGISLFVPKHARQQPAGLQYGYDVGINADAGDIRYRLCFECKCYKDLMRTTEDEKVKSLTIDSYSYNLIQYYMHCTPDRNNRWILVCPFGDLQADFQELLFDNWNRSHDHVQIFAITEEQSWITCEEFLSVDDRAYGLIYPNKSKAVCVKKGKEEIFQLLYDTIIYDSMEDAISEKLSSYSIDENGFLDCQTILDVQSSDGYSALKRVLQLLCDIGLKSNKSSPNMYGVYLIGEYGTGKTWLTLQVIREITRHPGTYPFDPVLIKMKELLSASERLTLASTNNIALEAKRIVKKYIQVFVNSFNLSSRYRRCKGFLFLLDGLDEVLSGFSYTNGKIEILSEVISELRSRYPSSLFVVTSRESDYNACKKHSYFKSILTLFHLVELSEFDAKDVQKCIEGQAEKCEKDTDHLRQLAANEKFLRIMQTPVFFTFLLDLVERPKLQQIKHDNERIDKYTILNEIVLSALEKLDQAQSIRQQIFDYAWQCTRDNLQEVSFNLRCGTSDEENDTTISRFIPTDIMSVRKITENECALSFKHNIIREFIATQQLYRLLLNCCSSNDQRCACIQFCQKLKELPLTVEMQQLFINCIERNERSAECFNVLERMACDPNNKSDALLATKLLELLLQPGHGISISNEKSCDLSGIHVHGLYIWRSFLRHINLRGAEMRELQLIDAELSDVDLRSANLSGLQICSDVFVKGVTFSRANKACTIAVIYNNGLILEYYLQSILEPEQYMVKVLGNIEVKGRTGVFVVGKKLLAFNDCKAYEVGDGQAQCIYEMRSEKQLSCILPSEKGQLLLIEDSGDLKSYKWKANSIHAQSIRISDPELFCYIAEDQYVIVRDDQLLFVHESIESVVSRWETQNTCFTAYRKPNGEICIYVFRIGSIKIISFSSAAPFSGNIKEYDILTNDYNTHRSAQCIDEGVLLTSSETAAFIVSVYNERCIFTELKTGVKCTGLELGDNPGEQRVEDDNAYHMLKALSSKR